MSDRRRHSGRLSRPGLKLGKRHVGLIAALSEEVGALAHGKLDVAFALDDNGRKVEFTRTKNVGRADKDLRADAPDPSCGMLIRALLYCLRPKMKFPAPKLLRSAISRAKSSLTS